MSFIDWIEYWYDMNDLSKSERMNLMNITATFGWNVWKFRDHVAFDKESFHCSNAFDASLGY